VPDVFTIIQTTQQQQQQQSNNYRLINPHMKDALNKIIDVLEWIIAFYLDRLYAVSAKMDLQTLHIYSNKTPSFSTLELQTDRWGLARWLTSPFLFCAQMEEEFFFPFHSPTLYQPLYSYKAVLVWGRGR